MNWTEDNLREGWGIGTKYLQEQRPGKHLLQIRPGGDNYLTDQVPFLVENDTKTTRYTTTLNGRLKENPFSPVPVGSRSGRFELRHPSHRSRLMMSQLPHSATALTTNGTWTQMDMRLGCKHLTKFVNTYDEVPYTTGMLPALIYWGFLYRADVFSVGRGVAEAWISSGPSLAPVHSMKLAHLAAYGIPDFVAPQLGKGFTRSELEWLDSRVVGRLAHFGGKELSEWHENDQTVVVSARAPGWVDSVLYEMGSVRSSSDFFPVSKIADLGGIFDDNHNHGQPDAGANLMSTAPETADSVSRPRRVNAP